MICPWLNAAGTRAASPREPTLTPALLAEFADAYAPDGRGHESSVSPIHADLRGLPPLRIETAADDPLAYDGRILAERALAAGVDVQHCCHEGLWHAFHLLCSVLAPADIATASLGRALRAKLDTQRAIDGVAVVSETIK